MPKQIWVLAKNLLHWILVHHAFTKVYLFDRSQICFDNKCTRPVNWFDMDRITLYQNPSWLSIYSTNQICESNGYPFIIYNISIHIQKIYQTNIRSIYPTQSDNWRIIDHNITLIKFNYSTNKIQHFFIIISIHV